MKTIVIAGFGLLGASFGLALSGNDFYRICCTRNSAARAWALANNAADEVTDDPRVAFPKADFTFLALPIPVILFYLRNYADCWKRNAVVTDMGSVKSPVMVAAEQYLMPRGVQFIGGHPMAGTEFSGHEHAFAEMFRGAKVFLCPSSNTNSDAVDEASAIWKQTGASVVQLTATEHDSTVAYTSHVQHLVVSALVHTVLKNDDARVAELRRLGCASGFRDTTRLASSNPAMWKEIMSCNTSAILDALEHYEKQLAGLHAMIADHDFDAFERYFAAGKKLRDSLFDK